MIADRIERETLIAAPLERVWQLVAEPGWWLADEADLSGKPGGEGDEVMVTNRHHGDFPVRVEKVQPQTYVAYRWVHHSLGRELRADNSTLVEFTLAEEGSGTRLRVVESGFAVLTGDEAFRSRAVKDNTDGWVECLDIARQRAERRAGQART